MPFTPPHTFTDGLPLSAVELKENDDAVRLYLHEGVIGADLKPTAWIQARHIQPPVQHPFTGVQHGVTGIQGGQWDGGALVRCQFGTSLLTGQRFGISSTDDSNWSVIPQTSLTIGLRKTATVLFHWWMESNNGPDDGSRGLGADAYMWVTEYNASGVWGGLGIKGIVQTDAQEVVNNHEGFTSLGNPPGGPEYPYTLLGYGNMSGTKVFTASQSLAVGLAHWSTIDRSAIINWGFGVEVYY